MAQCQNIITYGDHPLQEIKLFRFSESNLKTLVFIHGGAWRDPDNTYDDFQEVVQKIGDIGTNVIAINYRLSPEVKHPHHLQDVVTALSTLSSELKVTKVLVVGHSVGATLMLQLLNYKHIIAEGLKELGDKTAQLSLPETLQFETLLFVDGIYNVAELVEEYPDYIGFVREAFTSKSMYTTATQLSSQTAPELKHFEKAQFVVVQSQQDELLTLNQTLLFQKYLVFHKVPFTFYSGAYGLHEEVYRSQELADIVLDHIKRI